MLKVTIDYRPALFQRGGIARYARELAGALATGAGLDVHLFGHGWRRALHGTLPPPAATLHRTRLPGRTLGALAALGLDGLRLSGGGHVFHWTDYVYPPVRASGAVVQTVHDLAFLADDRYHGARESRRLSSRLRQALERADLVICPSHATRQSLVAAFPRLPPVRVVPMGVDHVLALRPSAARGRALAADWLRSDRGYGITVGTLEPRKNHDTLLAALDLLAARGKDLPWIFVGAAGWQTDAVRERLRRGSSEPRPRFVWRLDDADRDVFDLMAGARLLAYPSSLEGFGFPPLEAVSLGVPVVAGDCAALREQLAGAATYVDGRDAPALAAALARTWDEPPVVPRLALPSWGECARRHAEAYAEVALARRGAAVS